MVKKLIGYIRIFLIIMHIINFLFLSATFFSGISFIGISILFIKAVTISLLIIPLVRLKKQYKYFTHIVMIIFLIDIFLFWDYFVLIILYS
jgi:hypothetical protein